jgi:2-hydroxy-3-oxopropionate reductase
MNRRETRVAFIGLGIMGKPMAANLVRAGFEVTVHNRSFAAADELRRLGAVVADSPAEAASRATMVITMLPDTPDVAAVLTGSDGVLEADVTGSLLIDMSTISPTTAATLAAQAREFGAAMIDAPVSGGDVGAREGALSIMVGGAETDVERARPVLSALGKTIVHVGPCGAGQVVKAANQIVVALTIQAVAEALLLSSKAGLELAPVLDVLGGGLAANRVMEVRRRNFLTRDFTPGFRARLHLKDLRIALEAAHDYGLAVPATAGVTQLFEAMILAGHGESDHSGLVTVLEQLSHYTIPTGTEASST